MNLVLQDSTLVSLTEDEKKLKQIFQPVLVGSGILSIPPYDGNRNGDIKSEVE
ncbi:MAG TPA: hypothetical protein VJN71_11475 [Nitrososphaerales archaeon]|nr:hypothetical protein [Nitrososphaerales archaeon]